MNMAYERPEYMSISRDPREDGSPMINERIGDAGAEHPAVLPETPEIQEVERQGFSLAKALRSPRTLISFALAIAIVVFAVRGFDIDVDRKSTRLNSSH